MNGRDRSLSLLTRAWTKCAGTVFTSENTQRTIAKHYVGIALLPSRSAPLEGQARPPLGRSLDGRVSWYAPASPHLRQENFPVHLFLSLVCGQLIGQPQNAGGTPLWGGQTTCRRLCWSSALRQTPALSQAGVAERK